MMGLVKAASLALAALPSQVLCDSVRYPKIAEAGAVTPSLTYSSFTYQQMSTNRYATPLPSPLSLPTYAPAFKQASTLLPTPASYTTYSLNRSATLTDDGLYGQSAYAALWENITYSHDIPFTTTVSPTPVASAELVFPPQLPARPMNEDKSLKWPCDFIWGVAGSAWQIEGGLQYGGRGPSILDTIGALDSSEASANDSNVADMNYFLYKQDIARLAAIGVPYYSFTISWARVMPFGVAGSPINTEALDHYEDVIETCYEYGVTPIVTLLHADNPVGVMSDPDSFPDNFFYYAKVVMTRFADRVPIWFTINEGNIFPQYFGGGYEFLVTELKAHATVYHWYKEVLQGTGRISLKFANNLAVPLDPSNSSHVDAANRYQDFILGIMGTPLFLGQQIPESVLSTPDLNLTALTDDEISYINGTVDFWAFDPYTAQFVCPVAEGLEACAANSSNSSYWPECVETTSIQANGWLMGVPSEAYPLIAPQYVRQQLGYVWNTFRPSGIMISEFGFPQMDEAGHELSVQMYDFDRSMYYQNFLTEMLHAKYSGNVNIIGALAWSGFDNNEFGSFADQYGTQVVNRTDGLLTRRYKRSLFDFVDLFNSSIAC
jgi:beta-glucosidase/6-phospho-beta-glucosidase/beta-galactosidase